MQKIKITLSYIIILLLLIISVGCSNNKSNSNDITDNVEEENSNNIIDNVDKDDISTNEITGKDNMNTDEQIDKDNTNEHEQLDNNSNANKANEIDSNNNQTDNSDNKINETNDISSNEEIEYNFDGSDSINTFKDLIKGTNYNLTYSGTTQLSNASSIYVLVNKHNSLPSNYIPPNLVAPNVKFSFSGENEKRYLRREAATALESLFQNATIDGIYLVAVSGYRSYNRQKTIFEYRANKVGEAEANKVSARPGQSEHQTGLAMDVSCSSLNYTLEEELGDLKEGIWLKNNAHKHGFIIRYPKDKISITEYNYEPWHIRYIGKEIATYVYENNLTLEEFYRELNTVAIDN